MEQDDSGLPDDIISTTNKLLLANKINLKNCFEVDIASIQALKPYSHIEQGENWLRVSTHLISEAKIYSIKVESLHDDTNKLVNEYTRFSADTSIRKEPTKHQLDIIKNQVEGKLAYNPAASHLDHSLKNDVIAIESQPSRSILMLNNKRLFLDVLRLSSQLELTLACSTSTREAINQFKMSQQSSLLDLTSARDGFIRQMAIFKEFAEFNMDIKELSKEYSIQMPRGNEMQMVELHNEIIIDYGENLFACNNDSRLQQTRMDSMFTSEFSMNESFSNQNWSRMALDSNNKSSTIRSMVRNRPIDILNEHMQLREDSISEEFNNKKKKRNPRNQSRNKEIPIPIDFNPTLKLDRLWLKLLKLRGLSSVEYNQNQHTEPKVFNFQPDFIKEVVVQRTESVQSQQEPVYSEYHVSMPFISNCSEAYQTTHKHRRGNNINKVKQLVYQLIKEHGFVTDLKTILSKIQPHPVPNDMPFLFSALLHIAVEHTLHLNYGPQNIYIQRLA